MSKTKLRIHTWPDKILRKKIKAVTEFNESIVELLDEMLALMRVADGAGLAGNQVGLDLQLIVIEAEDRIFRLANPCIVKREGELVFLEGCLSFPDLELNIKRSRRIWVNAYDEKGEKVELEIEGVWAVVFQHEIDHLNGIGFIERASSWQKIKNYPRLKLIIKRTKDELRKQRKKS
jgi:peptide deformylase